MITFKFDLESQKDRYKEVKDKIKNRDFYQRHNFYCLPFMPEKFRGRVVFLPEKFEPEIIYKKHKSKIDEVIKDWEKEKEDFINKLVAYFPDINSVDIEISPSLYGTTGSYRLAKNKIDIYPRYDRNAKQIQGLLIVALTHYFKFGYKDILEQDKTNWLAKQEMASEIIKNIIKVKKHKSFPKMLGTQFAGKLAEESAKYLEKLKSSSKFELEKPENLTKSERNVLNLLLRNKNKLVTFDQIAEEVWREKAYDKFSEYAITTIIKKIKKKLKQKTDKNIIQAQRGVGYILHT